VTVNVAKIIKSRRIHFVLKVLLIEILAQIKKLEAEKLEIQRCNREKQVEHGDVVGRLAELEGALYPCKEAEAQIAIAVAMLKEGTFGSCIKCHQESLSIDKIKAILKSKNHLDWAILYRRTICISCRNGQKTVVGFYGGPRHLAIGR